MKKALVLQIPKKYMFVAQRNAAEMKRLQLWDNIYIVTDCALAGDEFGTDVTILVLSADLGFSGNLLRLMPHVEEEVFFFCPEDHRPSKVDKQAVLEAFGAVVRNPRIGLLRLFYFDRYPLQRPGDFISALIRTDKFYISIGGMGIWRKEYFSRFLVAGESAWDFERKGTKRAMADPEDRVFGTNRTIYWHDNVLKRGKINEPAIQAI